MTHHAAKETEPDERDLEQMERAMRAAGMSSVSHLPKAVPLEYAQRRSSEKAPFDWANSIRQLIFAAGVGFIAGAVTDVGWGSFNAWKDGEVMWIGFGAAMMALTLPWPGRIGRRRG